MKIFTTCALLSALSLSPEAELEGPGTISEKAARIDEMIDAHLAKAEGRARRLNYIF